MEWTSLKKLQANNICVIRKGVVYYQWNFLLITVLTIALPEIDFSEIDT